MFSVGFSFKVYIIGDIFVCVVGLRIRGRYFRR